MLLLDLVWYTCHMKKEQIERKQKSQLYEEDILLMKLKKVSCTK